LYALGKGGAIIWRTHLNRSPPAAAAAPTASARRLRSTWPVKVVSRTHTEYVWGGLRLVGAAPTAAPLRLDPVPGPDNLRGIWGWGGVSVAQSVVLLYTGARRAERLQRQHGGTISVAVKEGYAFAKRRFEAAGAGTKPQPLVAVWHHPTASAAVSPLSSPAAKSAGETTAATSTRSARRSAGENHPSG
jgi:hypothetical protein